MSALPAMAGSTQRIVRGQGSFLLDGDTRERPLGSRGRADAAKAKDGLAAQLARAFPGTVMDLCRRLKPEVPSAKPCRMQHPEGMKDRATRGELRAGHISGWGWDRLFAVAHSLGYEVVVTIRPREPAAA